LAGKGKPFNGQEYGGVAFYFDSQTLVSLLIFAVIFGNFQDFP